MVSDVDIIECVTELIEVFVGVEAVKALLVVAMRYVSSAAYVKIRRIVKFGVQLVQRKYDLLPVAVCHP